MKNNHGSDNERAKFLQDQGVLTVLFVDGIIQAVRRSGSRCQRPEDLFRQETS